MGMVESILLTLLPFLAKHAPTAVSWVVGAIVKAAVGNEAKRWLKDRTQRKAGAIPFLVETDEAPMVGYANF